MRVPWKPYPVKVYLGRGAAAHRAAAAAEQRERDGTKARQESGAAAAADRLAAALSGRAKALAASWLVLSGPPKHHGEWRVADMARTPRKGSRAWEEELARTPEFQRPVVESLAGRAAQGDEFATKELGKWLALHPELKEAVRSLDDLATKATRAWPAAAAQGDKLAEGAIAREAAELRAALLGPDPTPLERLLVGNVVVCHLMNHRAALLTAQPRKRRRCGPSGRR